VPTLAEWIQSGRHDEEATFRDAAHPTGTTRMTRDPRDGVVDENCSVHGVEGIYIAGSSVFPTTGHANPTLMIVALALRLADWLKLKVFHSAAFVSTLSNVSAIKSMSFIRASNAPCDEMLVFDHRRADLLTNRVPCIFCFNAFRRNA
jgi:GMC oxidoreductase